MVPATISPCQTTSEVFVCFLEVLSVSAQQQTPTAEAPVAYTAHQVALMLGCSPRTIQRSELIPGRLTINKGKRQTVRFLRTAVDQWLSDARK